MTMGAEPSPREADPIDAIIAIDSAARLLGISGERVRQMVRAGQLDKAQRGRVRLSDAVRGYIRTLKEEARRASQNASSQRLHNVKADRIELDTRVRRAELIEMDMGEFVFADVFQTLRDEIDGVPAASTRDLKTRAAMQGRLDDAFGRARKRFQARRAELQAGKTLVLEETAEEEAR